MSDLSHLGLGGQDKLKDDEDYAERMGVLTPLPFTDAALRERADAIGRKCGTWDAVPSEAAMRFVAEECYHAFIALRDAARAEQREARMLYNEAVTILLECAHGDEQTCGCKDRALERLAAIRAQGVSHE